MRAEDAGGEVGDRNADAHRPLAGQAGDRHQPAHALRDLVEARPVAIGAVLAEAGNAGIDQARIDRASGSRNRSPAGISRRAGSSPPARRRLCTRRFRISMPFRRFRLSVMLRLLRCRFWKSGDCAPPPRPPSPLDAFDLDDVGAPIGELAHAGRTRAHAGEIDDLEAGQGKFAHSALVFAGAASIYHGTAPPSPQHSPLDLPSTRLRPTVSNSIE